MALDLPMRVVNFIEVERNLCRSIEWESLLAQQRQLRAQQPTQLPSELWNAIRELLSSAWCPGYLVHEVDRQELHERRKFHLHRAQLLP